MSEMSSRIPGVSIVYSIVCSGADQRKHQCSSSLAFVRGIHRWPVNSPHKGPATRKMFPFDDVNTTHDDVIKWKHFPRTGNTNIYLHFLIFLDPEMALVVEKFSLWKTSLINLVNTITADDLATLGVRATTPSPVYPCSIGHYNDVIMGAIADQREQQSSASLAFVRGVHRGLVNFPHKGPVTRKMFPFDDVIMCPSATTTLPRLRQHMLLVVCPF